MKRCFVMLSLGLVICLSASLAFGAEKVAQKGKGMQQSEDYSFEVMDRDKNGKLTLDELQAYYPSMTKKRMAQYDTDKDGMLSPSEFGAIDKKGLGKTKAQAKRQREAGNPGDR